MTKLYKSSLSDRVDRNGIGVLTWYGHLSPCGDWVDGSNVRWKNGPEWCETEAESQALLAGQIAEIGARLIKQSSELLANAKAAQVEA